MATRILYIAELVGKAGVFTLRKLLPALVAERRIDHVVVCGDGATGGSGLGRQHAGYLRKLGAGTVTTGDGAFIKKDIVEIFPNSPWLLRPANYPEGEAPGKGWRLVRVGPALLGVVVLQGQSGFSRTHLDNPLRTFDRVLEQLRAEAAPASPLVLVDFHASTTAEKRTLLAHVDGRVSALIGSHGRVQTADATVTPAGTAFLTDAGRTGSRDSVGGLDPETRLGEYLSGVPAWAKDAGGSLELQACVVEIEDSGRARSIETLRLPCAEVLRD
ncbi:MAG: YmdB family metallophosphoesterase [Spirochaetales bacterium]|nr:YmdB family metallophosphoesterase [Spirochaetales bacterium]